MYKSVGFIGLGVMGLPMAANLASKGGVEVVGFDVAAGRAAELAAKGGKAASTMEEAYLGRDAVFLCLPTNDLVRRTVEAVAAGAAPGTVIVDTSSTAPGVIRALQPIAAARGLSLIDAPVSGGEAGALAGTLVFMCGGDEATFTSLMPLLLSMGSSATFMGGPGNGCVAKLANNMIVGCNIGAVAEAFAFAVKAGLDPSTLFAAIKDGFAGSAVMSSKAPKIIARDFQASARVAVHKKDLENAHKLAQEMGVEIPLSDTVLGYMETLATDGRINEDHCAVARVYEQAMEVTIG